MKQEKFSVTRQLKSFRHAIAGIRELIIMQHNARIHLTATIAVAIASFIFNISRHEAMTVTLAVGFVWAAEMFNTCIEKTMDFISMETHPEIKSIKDIAAGAVLVASVTAFIVGFTIFIPKIV